MIIKTETNENISINIEPSNTIRDVKEKIRHKRGIPLNQQLLVADDIELEDDRPVSYYDINNNSVIHLISMRFGLNATNNISTVTIKTEEGSRITLQIEPSNTIGEVKKKLQDQEGIPLEQQLLVINNAETDDHRTVSHYSMDDDSTIHLIRMGYAVDTVVHSPTVPGATANVTCALIPLSEFYVACRDNNVTKLRELLRTLQVEEMNKLEPNGSTGLHVACFRGHREVVKLLLKKGVSRSIMNRFKCLPYEEAASDEIRQLFQRIPGKDRYVANSGRVEWLLVASNAHALAARNIEAAQQYGIHQFESYARQIMDNYIKPYFRDVENYEELLGFFNMALIEKDPKYLLKAYTAETGFYTKLNVDLASETDVGKLERQLYIGILAFNPRFDEYRFSGEAYRGMRLTEDDLQEYAMGKKVMIKSFLSATTDKNEAEFFVGKNLRHNIHGQTVKMGVICTYIIRDKRSSLDVQRMSEYPKEKEVLIFPYSVFTVTKLQRNSQAYEDEKIDIILTQC